MENELHLTDLIDVEMLQRIQDAFSDMRAPLLFHIILPLKVSVSIY